MAWSSPATWVSAAIITAASLNQEIRDNLLWVKAALTTSGITSDSALSKVKSARCGVSLDSSGDGSLATATDAAQGWDSENWDTDAFHSNVTANSRITIPTGLDGTYLFVANVGFEANGTGDRRVWIEDSGGTQRAAVSVRASTASYRTDVCVSLIYTAAAADWFTVHVYQDSGSTLTIYKDLSRYGFSAIRLFSA